MTLRLDEIVERVRSNRPRVLSTPPRLRWEAATALVLHEPDGGDPELLLIERSVRESDRWSGHVALPGGRREPGEELAQTAARETLEEVGVVLPAAVGRLDDQHRRTSPGLVAPFVFALDERPDLRPDPREVGAALWVPLADLLDPDAAVVHRYAGVGRFPAIRYDDLVIWGLTLRTLESFFAVLGHTLPSPR